jgi:hypothetical protein
MDWGIGWQSYLSPHMRSTFVHPIMGSKQLESLSTPVPSSRGLGVVGALYHLALQGRISLSSYLQPQLK